jgi:1,2-diacylglycerol 3-alpha-glucosyltransferase
VTTTQMRIAIFSNTYHPTLNGVAKCVEYYQRGLRERGHEVVVFAPCRDDYDRSQDPDHVFRFPSLPIPLDCDYTIAAPYSRPVVKALRELQFDIIHTQHPFWVGAWGAWYARWTGTPLVTTVHTDYRQFAHLLPFPEPLVEAYMRVRVAAYCNKCEVVTTPVNSMRERLRRQGVRTPIEILPNPTEVEVFGSAVGNGVRRQHGIPEEALVLGYIGRLSAEKNLPFVIDAVGPLLQRRPELVLLLVGEGAEGAELRTLVQQRQLGERVIFAGAQPHERIPQYQAALDVFVTASRGETQPLAYTEAMAAGKPVVALATPGAVDMIESGHTGMLVSEEAGAQGYAARVEELLDDPDRRRQMGEHARKWVQQFDVPRVAERLEAIYRQAGQAAEEAPI